MNPREHQWKPNVTVAAVIEHDGRFLLVEEDTRYGIRYNQPAGHLEDGESLIEAVIRETLEESARDFTPNALLGIYQHAHPGDGVTYLRFAFTGTVSEPRPGLQLDAGIRRALWMSAGEIRACADRHRSPLLQRCVDDHLAGQRYPLQAIHHFDRNPA
ncbi:MAG: NUDIX hydrolase [Betaproteobacteria bacterium]|jgi:ADP-ribose pyrophosphatase YjhB (NUDIX family)|nr:NUDIX hydrolase [Betaproteobacteria bacterium]